MENEPEETWAAPEVESQRLSVERHLARDRLAGEPVAAAAAPRGDEDRRDGREPRRECSGEHRSCSFELLH
jgi:hypothetical protein